VSRPPDSGGRDRGTVRWRLRVASDGSGFHGFAAQSGLPTVAGALSEALSRVARTPVSLTCAGRTDSGVHALGQVVHFDVPAERSAALDPTILVKSCNSQVGPAIVVREAGIAPDGFDARHSATARRYRYLVVNALVADPLLARLTWHVPGPLDVRAMAAAADALLGEHDFRAFCRRVPGTTPDDPIPRRVIDARPGLRTSEWRKRAQPPGLEPHRWSVTCWHSRSRPMPSATRWSAPWSGLWSMLAAVRGAHPTCFTSSVPLTGPRPASRRLPKDSP
jgi:tRNA pseudouridine(38-40) synthase